ncbi:uncharacterized protein LOC100906647 [Galendromus occidentalis]|uniref:Uncharacterized protein LOC100906647 n=1 Tax=Galendromus occidentalis TaxID=34638 RepID=A0AAJ6VY41_9ACAR|nr:uncharacterized protein LOC100906647 [Galendromus occidentalis]
MGKMRKVPAVCKDSPLAKSAFFRRKEYDISWHAIANSVKKKKIVRDGPSRQIEKKKPCRDVTNGIAKLKAQVPNYKPRVSKEEMEAMGCEPIGILAKNTLGKSRDGENRQLSFSFGTLLNEKTPKRGTPLTQRCVVEMGRNKNKELEELEETVSKIRKAVQKGTMSVEEALTDIEGLKFRRQSSSSAKFFQLEMQLRKQKGDSLEACVACVRGIFAARDTRSRSRLMKELNNILKPIEAAGDRQAEADIFTDSEDAESDPGQTGHETSEISEPSPRSTYTPESVEMTPNVRTGSAAKTRLRFTPLLSSCQRRSNETSTIKKKRTSFKLTPLRRSTRVAAARSSQATSYMAVDI